MPQIQAHLARVIERMEVRDVAHLSDVQRVRRRQQLAALATYAADARFPQNRGRDYATPLFIGDDGRACAVGYLMIQSGARELACKVSAEANEAYVPDITVEGVVEWMDSVGLSLDECAMIQPAYGPCNGGATLTATYSCTPTALNSVGLAATLTGCGFNAVATNSAFLIVEGLPPMTTGYFLNSRDVAFVPNPGASQGTLCLGGAVGRHVAGVFTSFAPAFGPTWWGGVGLDLNDIPTPSGAVGIAPGETWHFQCWYRDANPTSTSNFSNVISVTFI